MLFMVVRHVTNSIVIGKDYIIDILSHVFTSMFVLLNLRYLSYSFAPYRPYESTGLIPWHHKKVVTCNTSVAFNGRWSQKHVRCRWRPLRFWGTTFLLKGRISIELNVVFVWTFESHNYMFCIYVNYSKNFKQIEILLLLIDTLFTFLFMTPIGNIIFNMTHSHHTRLR